MILGCDLHPVYQQDYRPQSGHAFVFIKASEGTWLSYSTRPDMVKRCRAAGQIIGHYHWLVGSKDPKAQARYFLDHADAQAGDVLACDYEDDHHSPKKYPHPTPAERWSFREECKRLRPDLREGLYCNRAAWDGTSVKAGDFLWLAAPGVSPSSLSGYPWLIHQYDWTPIDQDRANFGSAAEMRAWLRGLEPDDSDWLDDPRDVWEVEIPLG